jgi:hypothetical protein
MPAGVNIGKLGTCCRAARFPNLPILGPNWRRPPESEDSANERPHNKFRVFRFAAWLDRPPNHHTLVVQQQRRAGKSEDSAKDRPHNQFRVFQMFGLVSGRALETADSENTTAQ